MRVLLVIGWLVAFATSFAFALVTRRTATWVTLVLLLAPALYVVVAVRYGTH